MIVSSNEEKLKQAQRKDSFSKLICTKLNQEATSHHLQQIRETYKLENGMLIHINEQDLFNKKKIVVPQSLRSTILQIAHDESGHLDMK